MKNETAASASEKCSDLCGSALSSRPGDGLDLKGSVSHNELARLSQLQVAALLNVSRQTIFVWSRAGLPRNPDLTYDLAVIVCWLRSFYRASAEAKYLRRLSAMRKKVTRNAAQLQKFLAGGK